MLSCMMEAWSDTSSPPQPGHSQPACYCYSLNSGNLCVLLTLLSGGTGGKHPLAPRGGGGLHQPQVLLHLSCWHGQLEPRLSLSCKSLQAHTACPQSLVFLRDRVWLLHGLAAPLQQENGSPHTCVGTRHPRPTLLRQICRRRNLSLHIKFRGELNKAGDLHILYIPLASRHSLHALPGISEEDSGRLSALLSHSWQRGSKIQSSTFLWAFRNPRTFTVDLQGAISSVDGLDSYLHPAQHRAGQGRDLREGMPEEKGQITASPAQTAA